VSRQSSNSRSNRGRYSEVLEVKVLAETLGFNVSDLTAHKIAKLRELLREGLTLRKAQETLRKEFGGGLGWKNVEKYKLLIYLDPEIPIPIPKSYLRQYVRVFGWPSIRQASMSIPWLNTSEQLVSILSEVAKYLALKITLAKFMNGKIHQSELSKFWFRLCQSLIMVWIDEIAQSFLEEPMLRIKWSI